MPPPFCVFLTNIAGIKEAGGDMAQVNIPATGPVIFWIVMEDDALCFPQTAMWYGRRGISVAANIIRRHFQNMVRAALDGDLAKKIKRRFN